MNNNIYYQNNLQTLSNNIPRNSVKSSNNSINNYNYNNYSTLVSSIPMIFNIPKQTCFLNYQPSTPTRKKNIINLNDNSKLKRPSNISVVYKKLNDYDSLNNNNKVDYRYISPPSNKYINKENYNYLMPYTSNSQTKINLNEKIFRMAKTPEPKKLITMNIIHRINIILIYMLIIQIMHLIQ